MDQEEQGEWGELPNYEDFGENVESGMAETNYVEKGNDKKVLFAMAIGLADEHATPFLSWNEVGARGAIAMPDAFKDVRVSHIKPSNTHLVEEQKRRRTARGEGSVSVNTQARA